MSGLFSIRTSHPVEGVVAAYALVSALWIGLSDHAVESLFSTPEARAWAQTGKGWAFVAVTAVLLWAVLRRLLARHLEATRREIEATRESARASALLTALAEASPDAIFAKDPEGRYLMFNRQSARFVGMDAEAVVGRDDTAIFSPDHAALIRRHDLQVMDQDRPLMFEEELDTRQGRLTFLATKGPLHDAQGAVVGMFGISRDITEMVATRRRLAESERRYRRLFKENPQPMWVFDRRTLAFLAVNRAAERLYGYTRDEFLAMTIADIRPPDQVPALARIMASVTADPPSGFRARGTWTHLRKDGQAMQVEIASNDIDFDGHEARLVLATDVTEHRRAQAALAERDEALRRSEQRYRLAAAGGHVWDWDILADRTDTPAAFWQRLGTEPPRPERAARRLAELMHPEDIHHWQARLRAHLERGEPYDFDFRMKHADGRWRWFHTQGQAMRDDTGRPTYMAGTTFDITEQRIAEQALLDSQSELSELSQRLLDQERDTNLRLAQSLHDRLGQTLSSARLYLDLVRNPSTARPTPGSPVERLTQLLDQAVDEVRGTLVLLRPPLLEAQGLAASLRTELSGFGMGGLSTEVRLDVHRGADRQRWPDTVEYAAFMIAREAVANALRHAGASTVRVVLRGGLDRLDLAIVDDGIGIEDHERQGRPGHLGIVGMRERALAIGGRLTVTARGSTGRGTRVRLVWHRSPA